MTISQNTSPTRLSADKRVEELRQKLGYPVRERDPMGSDFYYLRPGTDADEAAETCPIAVGFYSDEATNEKSLKSLLTSPEWQQRIYGHYTNRTAEQQPVMYILLPTEGSGQVPLVLPTEGGLRQRNIQAFAWGSAELETRLNRLRQDELPVASGVLASVPLVERAFYKPIQTAKELAQLLATAARRIEQVLPNVYEDEKRRYAASRGEDGYLHKLLKSFQQELLPSLQLVSENQKDYSFSDIYAQTIAYSLFTARVFGYVRDRESGHKEVLFDRQSAWQQLPETNPFLRKLFQDVSERSPEELGDELIGAIADIFAILRAAKMDVILQDFRQKLNREDIVIRFYEDFLEAYDRKLRKRSGVYYTPEPVVSYMVRSVDGLLKDKFNKPLGLADPGVMILDPACGTGTFLLWICQLIYDRFHTEREAMIARVGDISWSEYVRDHLLPRIFGFELLMAPYAIAHLKLGLFLEETGYQFTHELRLGIYLTNALEQSSPKKPEIPYEEFIADEGVAALEIKQNKPIMLVIGNPPYSASTFEGEWIMQLVKDYKNGLNERKQDLNREEWKFLRFAQEKITKAGEGIAAFVINNTFLDAVTHTSLRKSVLSAFSEINILDLHGSVDKKEKAPDGAKDFPIFDIKQGVTIFISTKQRSQMPSGRLDPEINHLDYFGSRDSKNKYLGSESLQTTKWKQLRPSETEYFFFSNRSFNQEHEYESGISILDVFQHYASGVQTKKDHFSLHLTVGNLRQVIHDIQTLSESAIREKYDLGEDGRDWILKLAMQDVKSYSNPEELFQKIQKTPFNYFYTFYSGKTKGFLAYPRYDVFKNINRPNLGLAVMRQVVLPDVPYSHFFAVDTLFTDRFFYSNRGTPYFLPLYLYPDADTPVELQEDVRPNFKQEFLVFIKEKLGYVPPAESIFYYIYAIFHSPTYRSRYLESLKIKFPRVPFTKDIELFHTLQLYGKELVDLHVMSSSKLNSSVAKFTNNGGNGVVELGSYERSEQRVLINKCGDGFINVPEAVWNFYVGGYQVCAKWLKDRKGRTLTQEDILHYQRIIVSLQETMRLMQQIDEAIPEFPIV